MEINYQETRNPDGSVNPNIIVKLPDQLWIPNDPSNTDWQAYQVWLFEGNTPLPPDA